MAETDKFARHEALHMSLFLSESVNEQLSSHPVVKANPQWAALAETAERALYDLYQSIGAEHLEDDA
mgnify:CR=1 FL=1